MPLTCINTERLHNNQDCISVYNKELRIVFWNESLEKRYHITAKQINGKKLTDAFPYIKNDYRVKCLRAAIEQSETYFFPGLRYQYADGYYTQLIAPIKNKQGETVGCINIVRDQKQNETVTKEALMQYIEPKP